VQAVLAGEKGVTPQQLAAVDALLDYAGEARRAPGLFSAGGLMSSFTRKLSSSLNGVENVYTQHQPLLFHTLDALLRNKLKDATFPPRLPAASPQPPSEVVVFMVGGATFEEATRVAEFNAANPAVRVLLGGSCVHNSDSFLKEVLAVYAK
jgi:vacuolar protein sorting-associated protein 45